MRGEQNTLVLSPSLGVVASMGDLPIDNTIRYVVLVDELLSPPDNLHVILARVKEQVSERVSGSR